MEQAYNDNSKTEAGMMITDMMMKFCKNWLNAKEEDLEEFNNELHNLVADVFTHYIKDQIKKTVVDDTSLFGGFEELKAEMGQIKKQLKNMTDVGNVVKTAIKEDLEKKPSAKTSTEKTQTEKAQTEKVSTRSKKDFGEYATEIAMKYAEENNINPKDIVGTGKDGKITKPDIVKALKGTSSDGAKATTKRKTSQTGVKRECNGITKSNGAQCRSAGSALIGGKWYCARHKDQILTPTTSMELEEFDETNDIVIKRDSSYSDMKESADKLNEEMEAMGLDRIDSVSSKFVEPIKELEESEYEEDMDENQDFE